MSVQFGRWHFEGEPTPRDYIVKVSATLARYGPDSNGWYSKGGVNILYRAFHTTKESRREQQPHISSSGAVITWDGRLDNRAELIRELRNTLAINSTDIEIVSAAYEKWDTETFARLIGDWALSIWNPVERSLILAKDPIGPRHLYYSFDKEQVTWCTVLDPIVLFGGKTFALCEEYIAGWLSTFPAPHLTPYVGIHAVSPSSYVSFTPANRIVREYWNFDPGKTIRYHTEAEYEEHFRAVFAKAVQRRLRSDSPVLAELSGGRDSASIVCMADVVIARGEAETPRLDTISYYDDSEPNWNERPYFAKVEEKRGRAGWHVDVGLQDSDKMPLIGGSDFADYRLVPTPAFNARSAEQIRTCLAAHGNRVMLSGLGGDEVMGGVPTPTPEIQDLLAMASFGKLAHALKTWALQKRKPWFYLLLTATLGFVPPTTVNTSKRSRPARWLQQSFVNRHRAALTGYPQRVKLFGPLPSFQSNIATLNMIRRQLASKALTADLVHERRYPYLDRSLLEFMFSIPRQQSVRATQRRSLMRRTLVGIVPDEILNRKRKASVQRAPLVAISINWANLIEMSQHMISDSLGIVSSDAFVNALRKARRGEDIYWVPLLSAINVESWLRNLHRLGNVNFGTAQRVEWKFHFQDIDMTEFREFPEEISKARQQ